MRERRQLPHLFDEPEAGAHGALRVVLVDDRHTEHGHHGVADELLHDAAAGVDDAACQAVVLAQHTIDVFRIGRL